MDRSVDQEAIGTGLPLRAVDRAIGELRRGRSLVLYDGKQEHALVAAAELFSNSELARMLELADCRPHLVLTQGRAAVLGLGPENAGAGLGDRTGGVLRIELAEGASAEWVKRLADPLLAQDPGPAALAALPGSDLDTAAAELAKLAHLLPAVVVVAVDPAQQARLPESLLQVGAEAVRAYRVGTAEALERVSEAKVPLFDAEDARIISFRPKNGGFEHLAIVIGEAQAGEAVLVRLHSECLTGDLLGSLRCDCGDQLRGAIQTISAAGNGVLIYLAQEGRGIGLANKLRAYGLQDRGADTLEANEQLGFEADERIFRPAGTILTQLGIDRIRLLTNNPEKVQAMARLGIQVVERVPLVIPANPHNAGYLDTKARRFGHQF